jgi:nucleotide-binding universal stress UspA family protein
MFKTILTAVDGSEVGTKSLQAAIEEAKIRKAGLHAIYVVETGGFSSIPTDSTMEIIYSRMESEGQRALKDGAKLAEEHGIELTTKTSQGHAGEEILKYADEIGADLIVMGSHGKSEVERLLLGSVTDYVIKHSNVSTMVVRL